MSKTVVGLFSTMSQAQQVRQQLLSNGYEPANVHVVASSDANTTGSAASATTGTATGIGEKISNYFRELTGSDEDAHRGYTSGVQSGGAVLAVTVADAQANEIAAFLKQQGARDLEGGNPSTSSTTTGYAANTGYATGAGTSANVTGETVIPIIEEQVVVGKREVDHGGVRVYSHVVEIPVEAEVVLREEHIVVDRQPVNRAATEADFQAGRGGAIELNAMAEEAVVGKSSRVVEEVRLGKTSSERTEAIHETVRKTEVDVENLAAGSKTGSAFNDDLTTTTGNKSGY